MNVVHEFISLHACKAVLLKHLCKICLKGTVSKKLQVCEMRETQQIAI